MIEIISIYCLIVICLYVILLFLFPPRNKKMDVGTPENAIGTNALKNSYMSFHKNTAIGYKAGYARGVNPKVNKKRNIKFSKSK